KARNSSDRARFVGLSTGRRNQARPVSRAGPFRRSNDSTRFARTVRRRSPRPILLRRCTMFKRRNLTAIALVAVGALLGYAAASGHLSLTRLASAAPPDRPAASQEPEPALADGACCQEGLPAGVQLVRSGQKDDAPKNSKKPNIVFIMGDDIGVWNIGAYHRGMSSGKTPNLDRLASQGMLFTDYYAEASCTA